MPIAGALIGAGGALLASRSQSSAAKSAANASQQATDAAIAEQRRQFDLSRQDQMPWLNAGRGALSQLAGLYGLSTGGPVGISQSALGYGTGIRPDYSAPQPYMGGGYTGSADYSNGALPVSQASEGGQFGSFWQSPDYQINLNEGLRGLAARNSALGIQDSGAAQKAAIQFASNNATRTFGDYTNRLAALSGVGQTAANNNANLGQNFANSYSNLLGNNAQNLASSYQQRGAANANLWSTLAGIGGGVIGRL